MLRCADNFFVTKCCSTLIIHLNTHSSIYLSDSISLLLIPLLSAKQSAATTYFPIVLAINAVYLFLRFIYQRNSITILHTLITIGLVSLSYISYKGILEDHANTIPSKGNKSDALAGGVSLDLLGLVLIVQYGTIFISTKLYWLLLIIPIWGCYKLYTTFFGGKGGGLGGLMGGSSNQMMGNDDGKETAVDPQLAEKRQKRAERRRQKWS